MIYCVEFVPSKGTTYTRRKIRVVTVAQVSSQPGGLPPEASLPQTSQGHVVSVAYLQYTPLLYSVVFRITRIFANNRAYYRVGQRFFTIATPEIPLFLGDAKRGEMLR